MRYPELLHVLRAAAAICDEKEILVIGSNSIFGTFPDAPKVLTQSQDADICTPRHPEKADLLDGSIGEITFFQRTFGYYAHGITMETAVLPLDWKERAISLKHPDVDATIEFISPVDAAFSKLAAGRPKDFEWVRGLVHHKLLNIGQLARLIDRHENDTQRDILKRNFTIAITKTVDSLIASSQTG